MKHTLAYSPAACSLVPYVLLTEAGATFDTLDVNLGKGQPYTAEYLKLNPKGKVPTLLIDGGPLKENVAIQVWIAQQFPQARLMPTAPLAYARVLSFMAWCASGIHPKLTQQARPERYCDQPDSAANGLREVHRSRPCPAGTLIFKRNVVRGGGLEPPHPCGRQDLNLVRLPISPPALGTGKRKRAASNCW
jgi:hypothetical protein